MDQKRKSIELLPDRIFTPGKQVNRQVVANLAQPQRIGNAFAFSRLWSPNGWPRSVWPLEFYGCVDYLCIIGPVDTEANPL